MVLYEPIIGNTSFNNILEYKDLVKFINNGELKKEYERYKSERKERSRHAEGKK